MCFRATNDLIVLVVLSYDGMLLYGSLVVDSIVLRPLVNSFSLGIVVALVGEVSSSQHPFLLAEAQKTAV